MKINKYSTQYLDKFDYKYVLKSLSSDSLTQGGFTNIFEKNLSLKTKSNYSLTFNSATSALHIACLCLGVNNKDIVWTSVNSFVASANCALYCGAKLEFLDIDLDTFNISLSDLHKKLEIAKKVNKLPKVLIIVHLAGSPCDMKYIHSLSKKFNFKIIEDSSHALGSIYKSSTIGSCKYSDISIFSFHPVKMITTGEGGSLHTNKKSIYNKAKLLRSHGINKNIISPIVKKKVNWYYEQSQLGYNYRLSDINAALGYSQLKKINKFVKIRNTLAKIYDSFLKKNHYLQTQKILDKCLSSYHLYIILIKKNSKITNHKLMEYLSRYNIATQLHYLPIHLHPFYRKFGFKKNDFPNAEYYSKKAISLPLHCHLTDKDIIYISNKINNFFKIV